MALHISNILPTARISFIKNIKISRLNEGESIETYIDLRYDRLLMLACIITDFKKFKGVFDSNRKKKFLASHLGGGLYLSVCDVKYGVRLGYFHMVNDLLTPTEIGIYIYSKEWNNFYNIICDYGRQIRLANIHLCWETNMHRYWEKFWGGCLECYPFDKKSLVFAKYE